MTQEKFDLMCEDFEREVLEKTIKKDEPDAKYTIHHHFNPMLLEIDFIVVKERDPRYMIDKMYYEMCSISSYELETWYDWKNHIVKECLFKDWKRMQ